MRDVGAGVNARRSVATPLLDYVRQLVGQQPTSVRRARRKAT